ncbi:hypothetical protein GWK48_05750 [Metallosphaera tengchongensis]|uniref:Uncharacterized protein n=1 Tax=Metallosphaera tengchongensis TaxID=1532350 RepID=A0A6N0NWD3_9CREN|nr:DNA import protein CedA [Metallosphaera tengchongensis]QKQ99948.1 hypothetical protein GWK48_05750 [Metallosphaera tengchongensis]
MNAFEILAISQDLSSLTYFIGALIMALPLPVYGLKRWGPRMIVDGIYASILVNLYESFLTLMENLGNMLGVNWAYYMNWIYQLLLGELEVYTTIKTIYSVAISAPYSGFNPFLATIGLLLSMISGFMSVTGTIIVISQLILNYSGLIISLGILLMSLPFRIGRSIGGSMIAFGIVFYLGLPLLPNFLSSFGVNILQQGFSQSELNSISGLATIVIPAYIEGTVLMPLAYIGILTSITLGLGSAISGSYSRLPIPVDFL